MEFLIILTLLASTFASKICTKEYFNSENNFNTEFSENELWPIKKAGMSFNPYKHVDPVLFHFRTAFRCNYVFVQRIKNEGIKIIASNNDPKECPPVMFPWKSQSVLRNYFTNERPMPFSYIYKFVYKKYFIIVACVTKNQNIAVSAMAFVDRNISNIEMKHEILEVKL